MTDALGRAGFTDIKVLDTAPDPRDTVAGRVRADPHHQENRSHRQDPAQP